MMKWFGENWGAAICADSPRVPTPVGTSCLQCDEPIEDGDCGVMVMYCSESATGYRPMHIECHLRTIAGGANHQIGKCTCCGGTLPPDPPGLTKREAAKLAMKVWRERQG